MPKRIFRWRGNGGGVKSDFDDGRNWVNENGEGYVQATFPGSSGSDTDYIVFDAALEQGALAPTTNVDRSSDTAVASIRATREYMLFSGSGTGGIGGPSSPLKINVTDEVLIDAAGCGDVYIESGGDALTNVKILGGYSGKTISLGGAIDGLTILKGSVDIKASSAITSDFYIGYVSNQNADAVVKVNANCTLPSSVTAIGGAIECLSALTVLNLIGGTWNQSASTNTLNLSGGRYVWRDGAITAAWVSGGTLDASLSSSARALNEGHVAAGGVIDLAGSGRAVAIANWIEMLGGNINWPDGARVTMAT